VQNTGKVCILDIDVQGVKNVKKSSLNPYYVFISPPSMEKLVSRLRGRGTESDEDIQTRLGNAVEEMVYGHQERNFDFVLVNDDLQSAFDRLVEVIKGWYPALEEAKEEVATYAAVNQETVDVMEEVPLQKDERKGGEVAEAEEAPKEEGATYKKEETEGTDTRTAVSRAGKGREEEATAVARTTEGTEVESFEEVSLQNEVGKNEAKEEMDAIAASTSAAAVQNEETLFRPLVFCGPSGAGKGTLIDLLMTRFSDDEFGFSVSHTTRKPREGEINGKHYHFTTAEKIKEEIAAGKFIEYAEVHGKYYGTRSDSV